MWHWCYDFSSGEKLSPLKSTAGEESVANLDKLRFANGSLRTSEIRLNMQKVKKKKYLLYKVKSIDSNSVVPSVSPSETYVNRHIVYHPSLHPEHAVPRCSVPYRPSSEGGMRKDGWDLPDIGWRQDLRQRYGTILQATFSLFPLLPPAEIS